MGFHATSLLPTPSSQEAPPGQPKSHTPWGRLQLSGYRYYNPDLGRWVSRDPIGEDREPNLYGFVFNSPENMIHRDGLVIIDIDRPDRPIPGFGEKPGKYHVTIAGHGHFDSERKCCQCYKVTWWTIEEFEWVTRKTSRGPIGFWKIRGWTDVKRTAVNVGDKFASRSRMACTATCKKKIPDEDMRSDEKWPIELRNVKK